MLNASSRVAAYSPRAPSSSGTTEMHVKYPASRSMRREGKSRRLVRRPSSMTEQTADIIFQNSEYACKILIPDLVTAAHVGSGTHPSGKHRCVLALHCNSRLAIELRVGDRVQNAFAITASAASSLQHASCARIRGRGGGRARTVFAARRLLLLIRLVKLVLADVLAQPVAW